MSGQAADGEHVVAGKGSRGDADVDDQSKELGPLLEHLAATAYPEGGAWQSWRFGRVAGGMNTIVYRLGDGKSDLAIKVTRRDARDRAGREYSTLRFLEQLGLSLAPRAVFLDRERFPQPVVVQQWVDGDVRLTPPEIDDDWQQLLAHLLAVHRITPE
jgi:hypothetical protein